MSREEKVLILGGLLKRIGNFSSESFEESFDARLIFQKTIYLLQAFGLYLGYKFSWYIRGPYSPDLAREGFTLLKEYETSPDVKFENPNSEKKFCKFNEFLHDRKCDPDWLETLASIHFLANIYPKKGKEEIFKTVMRKQPYITMKQCEEAWNYLKEYGLID